MQLHPVILVRSKWQMAIGNLLTAALHVILQVRWVSGALSSFGEQGSFLLWAMQDLHAA
jgi:hypothetical protein